MARMRCPKTKNAVSPIGHDHGGVIEAVAQPDGNEWGPTMFSQRHQSCGKWRLTTFAEEGDDVVGFYYPYQVALFVEDG